MSKAARAATIVSVAKALSGKHGVKVTISGSTAYTDMDSRPVHVNIPIVENDDDAAIALARGYIDHEVGHVRYTKKDDLPDMQAFEHALWNICEDMFVERKMGEAFAGCAVNFKELARMLFAEDEKFDVARGDYAGDLSTVCNFILLSARSLVVADVRDRADEWRRALDAGLPGLASRLDACIKRTVSTGSTAECWALACEMRDIINQYISDQQSGQDQSQQSGQGQGQQSGQDQSQQSGQGQQHSAVSVIAGHLRDAIGRDAIEADDYDVGGSISERLDQHSVSKACHDLRRLTRGKPIPESIRNMAAGAMARLRSKLSGLLQAEVMQYGKRGRVGTRVSTRRLFLAMVSPGTEIFMRRKPQRGIDTHVIILLDASASMHGSRMPVACAAMYASTMACQQPGVVVSAFAFNSCGMVELVSPRQRPNPSHMYAEPDGSTPLFEAGINVLTRFDQRCARRILVMLTDGVPDSEYALPVFKELCASTQVELVGIGIQSEYLQQLLPDDAVRTVGKIGDFPDALAAMLLRVLTGRRS